MLEEDLRTACLLSATEDNKNNFQQNKDYNTNRLIKIIQLEKLTENDVKIYLSRVCNNQMTIPTIEIMLSIIRLYPLIRLKETPHINNPQAFAVIKDLEDYLVESVSRLLFDNKENIVINESKVSLIKSYFKKCYFNFNLWKIIKTMFQTMFQTMLKTK